MTVATERTLDWTSHDVAQRHSTLLRALTLAAQASIDGIAILGPDERYQFVNDAHARIYGLTDHTELIGHSWHELYGPEERERIERVAMSALARDGHWRGCCTGRRVSGTTFPQELSLASLPGGGLICIVRDDTAQALAQAALHTAIGHQTALLNNIPDCAWIKDEHSRFIAVNDAMAQTYGIAREVMIGTSDRDFFPAEVAERFLADDRRVMEHGERLVAEYPVPLRGFHAWIETAKAPVYNDDRRIIGTVGIARDVTSRHDAEDALRQREAHLRAIVDRSAIGIAVTNTRGVIVETNPAFQRMVGYTAEELCGRFAEELTTVEDANAARGTLCEIRAGIRDSATIEKRYVRKDGELVWVSVTLSSIQGGPDRGVTGIVAMAQDITSRKAMEQQLMHRAYHDELTGLPNRVRFRERVEEALARRDRPTDRIAVMFLDLDDFKEVNDRRGHQAGDRFLRVVAERLLNATRGSDTVARLGGDEFGILLQNVQQEEDFVTVGVRVITSLSSPVQLDDYEVTSTASVGIARAYDGSTTDEILRQADLAMYRAKAQGKGRLHCAAA